MTRKPLSAKELLDRFGLMTEQDVARLLGISVKTLKNRAHADLPTFTKTGRQRLFYADSVAAYLKARSAHCFDAVAREMAG